MLTMILLILVILTSTGLYTKRALYFMQMLQQNGYLPSRYLQWIKVYPKKAMPLSNLLLIALALVYAFAIQADWLLILLIAMMVLHFMRKEASPVKKRLVYTSRVKRTCGMHGFLYVLTILVVFHITSQEVFVLFLALTHMLNVILSLVAIVFLLPVEKLVNRHYLKDAQKVLSGLPNLKVIGITGSYGKTTTKHILERILSQKYNVVMTPGSYNTTMGNVITIRKDLNTLTEIFISEMGAKGLNEIKEICDLVHPDIGVLTSIGPQHLETFKTIEGVIKTKFELIDALKPGGLALLNVANPYIKDNYRAHLGEGVEAVLYGEGLLELPVTIHSGGMGFSLPYEGTTYDFETKLLGHHNISNLVAGITLGFKLGMTYEAIYQGVKSLEPVEHRLEIKNRGQYTLIDDAFNSNPEGAKMALEVLKTIEGGQKIIITPGMIELGPLQYELNKNFGKQMCLTCDYVILVGKKQTLPIQDGLEENGYPKDKMVIVNHIYEAFEHLHTFVQPSDVVLIENDLPDNFNE